jgi:hypothetical protein
MLDNPFELNISNDHNKTMLLQAFSEWSNRTSLAARLLRNGADPSFVARREPFPLLHMAILSKKDIDVVLFAKPDLNARCYTGNRLIHEAANHSFSLVK